MKDAPVDEQLRLGNGNLQGCLQECLTTQWAIALPEGMSMAYESLMRALKQLDHDDDMKHVVGELLCIGERLWGSCIVLRLILRLCMGVRQCLCQALCALCLFCVVT